MNDRGLEINWDAGKPTPMIDSYRCEAVVGAVKSNGSTGP